MNESALLGEADGERENEATRVPGKRSHSPGTKQSERTHALQRRR